jgi:hypothetical protein
MRILVTTTHTLQDCAIVLALRPHASRVVATVEGDSLLAPPHQRVERGRELACLPMRWMDGR